MKLRITTSNSQSLKSFKESIPTKLSAAQRVIGRNLADKTSNEVKDKIPTRGGWYSIYKNAIKFLEHENGNEWAVAGLSEIELSDPPADQTLILFSGNDTFSGILSPYNPWPIDFIPPIGGGYRDTIIARASTPTEVASSRNRLSPLLLLIRKALENAGASLGTDAELPVINGKVYADLAYLARRLELGFTGFLHIPHWQPTASKLENNGEAWGTTPEQLIIVNDIICGKSIPDVQTMSESEAEALAKIRNTSWS